MTNTDFEDISLLTRKEAASLMRVSLPTLDLILRGSFAGRPALRAFIRSGRLIRIAPNDIKDWLFFD